MRLRRLDLAALVAFAAVAVTGLWLWTGVGPLVWVQQFAVMCGF